MSSFLSLVVAATLLLAPSIFAESDLSIETFGNYTLAEDVRRQLDGVFQVATPPPTRFPTKAPTAFPTKNPTPSPTRNPTPSPTSRPPINTNIPTETLPPRCGTFMKGDGSSLLLGPYDQLTPPTDNYFGYHLDTMGSSTRYFFRRRNYWPQLLYDFRVTARCEYQYTSFDNHWGLKTVRDVNQWFEQVAHSYTRVGNVGYKHSEDDIIFSGFAVPDYYDDVTDSNIPSCPEDYCVMITGPSITRKSIQSGTDPNAFQDSPELLYAFSSWNDMFQFKYFLKKAILDGNRDYIFMTNHFLRCGREPFCVCEDDPWDDVHVQATCYVEELCGQQVFKIAYAEGYPEDERVSWASTGTTEVMEWFDECAAAMYSCTETEDSNKSLHKGTRWGHGSYKGYPKEYKYEILNNQPYVYGLGGSKYVGFPHNGYTTPSEPDIAWTCPTLSHRNKLEQFGQYVKYAEFMRDTGFDISVPDLPCQSEVIEPPIVFVDALGSGPNCDDISGHIYCYRMRESACYVKKTHDHLGCQTLQFFRDDSTSTQVYDESNMQAWFDDCLDGVGCTIPPDKLWNFGTIALTGVPSARTQWDSGDSVWQFKLTNSRNTIINNSKSRVYDCDDWQGASRSKNFTESVGNRHNWIRDPYNWKQVNTEDKDLFDREPCTSQPSSRPSDSPTISIAPSNMPSDSPTLCSETYLTSNSLNIAMAIDLSYSTYDKQFSGTDPVGDLNGDGKANTILDAQVAAIQELLTNIAKSPNLDNSNCELELISFGTDAESHGVWAPLSSNNEDFNPALMAYVKANLWAPLSLAEMQEANNGFTNFDAALDASVEYFTNRATPDRTNLLVFLSDGEPNVRGDGDDEGYCSETAEFFVTNQEVNCADLELELGERHEICRGNDPNCVFSEPYQDCVRGPNQCENADAVLQYGSEIQALSDLGVERLAIGVGEDSNVAKDSGLWIIDNNPAKYLGVLPLQAMTLDELSEYLSSLCILNTDPPTVSPSEQPSSFPTESSVPSALPTESPSKSSAPSVSFLPSFSGQCPSTMDDDIEGISNEPYGLIKMCVRSSLGYTDDSTSSLFKEVNFIESLIKIKYSLTGKFCVTAFNVEPKQKEESINLSDEKFGLEAYLCDTSKVQIRTNPDRTLPSKIDSTYLEEYSNEADKSYFNQGSLITVCVAPDDEAYEKDIRMNGLKYFNWKRNDLNMTAGNLPIEQRIGTDQLIQEAIGNGVTANNGLTSYYSNDCVNSEYCHFSSILFADFYITRGVVFGGGSATVMFKSDTRRLLEESSDKSSFDVAVPVGTGEDDSDAPITAGGSCFVFDKLFSVMAVLLLSAVLSS